MKLINLKEADISLANGGKINGLIQLKQHNFPVPEGWLIKYVKQSRRNPTC